MIDGISDAVIEEQQKWYPERKAVNGELNPLISPKDASRTKPETVKVHFDVSLVTRETTNGIAGERRIRLRPRRAAVPAQQGPSEEDYRNYIEQPSGKVLPCSEQWYRND